jgi:hypothetical protein
MHKILRYAFGLIIWLPGRLIAQHVLYTEPVLERAGTEYRVIGKSASYYWIEKLQKRKNKNRNIEQELPDEQSLLLFDSDLNLIFEQKITETPGTLRQWLVPGEKQLDKIIVYSADRKTYIVRAGYSIIHNADDKFQVLDSFLFHTSSSQLIMARSADRSKILMLAFEDTENETTRVNAILFDGNWNQIYHKKFSSTPFALPCVQDEDDHFLSEQFDDLPVKVANNGDWLMAFPSRINRNYALFHVGSNGNDFTLREVKKFPYYNLEDIAMFFDDENQVADLGLLSGYPNTSLKHVEACRYSFKEDRVLFDTSYNFNTQANDFRNKNLSHERFMSASGHGYLYLKEYGTSFEFKNPDLPFTNYWEATYLLAGYQMNTDNQSEIKKGYSYNNGLRAIPQIRHSGDLNLFYFPSISKDSTWSGIVETEQHSNTNFPSLSYLILPIQKRVYVLYNTIDGYTEPFVSTTMVNLKGQETGGGLVFWKTDRVMDFQHYRRITDNEIAAPYRNGRQTGFAIIRFPDN